MNGLKIGDIALKLMIDNQILHQPKENLSPMERVNTLTFFHFLKDQVKKGNFIMEYYSTQEYQIILLL